jgi:hypothetical protein
MFRLPFGQGRINTDPKNEIPIFVQPTLYRQSHTSSLIRIPVTALWSILLPITATASLHIVPAAYHPGVHPYACPHAFRPLCCFYGWAHLKIYHRPFKERPKRTFFSHCQRDLNQGTFLVPFLQSASPFAELANVLAAFASLLSS